jgi:glycosyltransferase involved in cell wall biosynthesis
MDMANPYAGGAEVHLLEIFKRFVERGDHVTLLSSGFEDGEREDEYEGIRIFRQGSRETYNYAVIPRLRRLLSEEHFDIVVEDINKVPLMTPLFIKRKPLLVMVPHLFGTTVYKETNALFASYVYFLEQFIPMLYQNAKFEVISPSTAIDLAERGIDARQIEVVYCGVDHETYFPVEGVERFEQPTILHVGRLMRYKSVDVLLRAIPFVAKQIKNVRAVIVGDGESLNELKSLAAELGIEERVEFTGFINFVDKVEYMRKSHVIVNPSPKEGWGLTNIEANACGTPAIASDAPGLRDSVKDGETGLLFPYGDHLALADSLVRFFSSDLLQYRFRKNAIEWAKRFTWDTAARKTMRICDQLIGRM